MTYRQLSQLSHLKNGLGSVSYSYDNMNRLTQESRSLTNIGTFNTCRMDNIKGDVTSMTYPSGRVVNFNYATGGGCCNSRLSSVIDQTTNVSMNGTMNYDAAGDLRLPQSDTQKSEYPSV